MRELLLRVRAILRRAEPEPAHPAELGSSRPSRALRDEAAELVCGGLRVDPEGHRAWVDGEEVILTALELKLLTTLLSRRGRVQTREQLLDDLWGIQADVTTRTVDTHVKRLRQKLGRAAGHIETLRGGGYRSDLP